MNANGVVDVPGDILQENHYYSFGMNMNYGWMNAAALDNRYQYNGIERNDDFGLNLDLAVFRAYDASVGRWWQVDPKPNLSSSSYSGFLNNPILFADPLGDTTRVYSTHGKYVGTINDSKKNEEHFVSLKRKGVQQQKRLISEANKSLSSANKAAEIVRHGSKYYIGTNTRNDLKKISSMSVSEHKERLFILSYSSKNKELRASDLSTEVPDRGSGRINPHESQSAISDFIENNSNLKVIGWGHIHPQQRNDSDSNFDMSGLHEPSYPGDFQSFNIKNYIDGGIGNIPSVLATRYGYVVYTTANPSMNPETYEGGPIPAVYNFNGKEIYKLSNK